MNGPKHNKKFVIGMISLTMERPRKDNGIIAKEICEKLDKKLIEENFFEGLPFQWIEVDIFYGIKDEPPVFKEVNKKYCSLYLTIEVYCGGMRQMTLEEFIVFLEKPIYKTMVYACELYKKDPQFIHDHFRHLSDI